MTTRPKLPTKLSWPFALVLMASLQACSDDSTDNEQPGQGAAAFALEPAFPSADFEFPTDLDAVPGQPGLYLVSEKRGLVLLVDEQAGTVETAADLTDRVSSDELEQGLFSLAFPPDFTDGGEVIIYYTQGAPRVDEPPHRRILSGFIFSERRIDESSERQILALDHPGPPRHYGGGLAFGPDGYLYLGLGDASGREDRFGRAQDLEDLDGSILRIALSPTGYGIPPDNPFAGNDSDFREEIYAYGFRNPYRLAFDFDTGDLWVADTGQQSWEEVNLVQGGGNYGWNIREGFECQRSENCEAANFIDPVSVYSQDNGDCAIIGGHVYRGADFPDLAARFIYSDYCSGRLWAVTRDGDTRTLIDDAQAATYSVVADESGEILVLSEEGISRLVAE